MLCRKIMKPFVCEQDHSDSKQLLGVDLADNMKEAKTTNSMNQSISNKSLRVLWFS